MKKQESMLFGGLATMTTTARNGVLKDSDVYSPLISTSFKIEFHEIRVDLIYHKGESRKNLRKMKFIKDKFFHHSDIPCLEPLYSLTLIRFFEIWGDLKDGISKDDIIRGYLLNDDVKHVVAGLFSPVYKKNKNSKNPWLEKHTNGKWFLYNRFNLEHDEKLRKCRHKRLSYQAIEQCRKRSREYRKSE